MDVGNLAVDIREMSLPRKPCHNCRRRRLRCDRSLPQCHKCTKAGRECLGYQALLIWTQGVASRGSMSGLTFEDMEQQRKEQASPRPVSLSPTSAPRDLHIAVVCTTAGPKCGLKSVSQKPLVLGNRLLLAKHKATFEDPNKLPLGRHLTDPFFQGLNQDARFYISHCKLYNATFLLSLLRFC